MSADNIISALGGIDEKYISEYREEKRKNTHTAAICGIAACIVAVLAVSVFLTAKALKENAVTDPHDFPPMISFDSDKYYVIDCVTPDITDESKLKYIGTVNNYVSSDEWLKNQPDEAFCTNDESAIGAKLYEYDGEIIVYCYGKFNICIEHKRTPPITSETSVDLNIEDGTIKAKAKSEE